MYDRLIDRYDAEGERIFKMVRETGVPRADDLERVDQNIQKAEREITRLVKLSVDISLGEFETVEQLRIKMKHELELINSVLYKV
jgi:tRNA U34 5-carboxymethylaminomethyl modifying enzyme MnmG/GidA